MASGDTPYHRIRIGVYIHIFNWVHRMLHSDSMGVCCNRDRFYLHLVVMVVKLYAAVQFTLSSDLKFVAVLAELIQLLSLVKSRIYSLPPKPIRLEINEI